MKVLITDYVNDANLERNLFTIAGIETVVAQCRSPEEVIAAADGAECFIAPVAPITREVFEAVPELCLITVSGVGVDHIDLEAAKKHRVWVANVPDANVEEVAAHAFAMCLSLIRNLPIYDRAVRAGTWDAAAHGILTRPSMMTLGIAGLGHIGRIVARLAQPCFGKILGHDPFVDTKSWPEGVVKVSKSELLAGSDVMSLHMPLTAENKNFINPDSIAQMRPGSFIVNCSRGPLVDVDALHDALENGHIAAAALDVMPVEPPPTDHPVVQHPRVLITPHAAYYSEQSDEETRRKAVINILSWWKDGYPPNVIVKGKKGVPL